MINLRKHIDITKISAERLEEMEDRLDPQSKSFDPELKFLLGQLFSRLYGEDDD